MKVIIFLLFILLQIILSLSQPKYQIHSVEGDILDLKSASIVISKSSSQIVKNSVKLLVDETYKRSKVRLPIKETQSSFKTTNTSIYIFLKSNQVEYLHSFLASFSASTCSTFIKKNFEGDLLSKPESYSLCTDSQNVVIIGFDERGILFGIGKLLRIMNMEFQQSYKQSLQTYLNVSIGINLSSSPSFSMRGQMISYRSVSNCYDGWTPEMVEQYVKDLAIFGTNQIEFVGPDGSPSPHFTLPLEEMLVEGSSIVSKYGLDVSIWYPVTNDKNWNAVLRRMPKLNSLFVPSGDPGDLAPKDLFKFLEIQSAEVKKIHPNMTVWVSNQEWNDTLLEDFYQLVAQKPQWLTGIVYGPHTRDSPSVVRKRVPSMYPIRQYPDIAHMLKSEFMEPNWNPTIAITEAREAVNPRPTQEYFFFQTLLKDSIGFGTYSDGCNDDVNKIIWSSLGWNSSQDLYSILLEYSRYFINRKFEHSFAQSLLDLEQNWQSPLESNNGVEQTLKQFQAMEAQSSAQDKMNWRFLTALYRAYYDAWERRRLLFEEDQEAQALSALARYSEVTPSVAIDQAQQILSVPFQEEEAELWKRKIFVLAEALYQTVTMQLSVPLYMSISVGRGANLDTLEMPLNNRMWLFQTFAVLKTQNPQDQIKGIQSILNWQNPGLGGFYDNLGIVNEQPHLLPGMGWKQDPLFLNSSNNGFAEPFDPNNVLPYTWYSWAETYYDIPLELYYENLDSQVQYRVKVVYSGDAFDPLSQLKLIADHTYQIHPYINKPLPIVPLEFPVPKEATSDGKLLLTWYPIPFRGGNGRACQVAEVWLINTNLNK